MIQDGVNTLRIQSVLIEERAVEGPKCECFEGHGCKGVCVKASCEAKYIYIYIYTNGKAVEGAKMCNEDRMMEDGPESVWVL